MKLEACINYVDVFKLLRVALNFAFSSEFSIYRSISSKFPYVIILHIALHCLY